MKNVLTFILAGGRGERLNPLTRDRAKPAVPFGGAYRIVDFTLSNCINSGLRRAFVLIQYKSFSLQKHILAGWDVVSSQLGEFIDVVPAQMRTSDDWYLGTADAIHQNMNAIQDWDPDLILVLAGDHLYKMDYRKMIDYHLEKGADMTVSCVCVPKEDATGFGIVEVDSNDRVSGFQEKPKDPKTLPEHPDSAYASMGIYLFSRKSLEKELAKDADNKESSHDFGKNIIPQMIQDKQNVYAYNYDLQSEEPGYWRDIGTRDAYYESNMDLVGPNPKFNLYDRAWPLRTHYPHLPPVHMKTVEHNGQINKGCLLDSIVSPGCRIEGAHVEHSVLSPSVQVKPNAKVVESVLMDGVVVEEGAQVQKAIIDKYVTIPAGEKIGFDLDKDRERFDVTRSGIVIVAKKTQL